MLTQLCSFVDYGTIHPVKYFPSGYSSPAGSLSYDNSTSISLSSTDPLIILDYGTEVAGFPFFITTDSNSAAQIEVKYSEELSGLWNSNADGPWTFSNGLSNTFRVETFEIKESGYLESFFVQGGQRWQSIRLLSNGSITFNSIGLRATSEHMHPNQLPGHMKTDNPTYNKIFDLGGDVVQAACVDAGNAPSTWEITDEGALIRGQATAQSAEGILLEAANYTIEFQTKIIRGGTGWRIASGGHPYGPYFVLTSDYVDGSVFLNVNKTLMPSNTLIFNSGWSIVNQSTLATPANQIYPLNLSIAEDKWYRISTTIEESGYRVRIDGAEIAFVPLPTVDPTARFASASSYEGTWGFGGFQDHISLVTDVTVTSKNGSQIYESSLTSNDTLVEYGVAPLDHSVCLDGAKRDRLVWTGDFYHTVRVLAQTSARWDYLLGSIDLVFGYQVTSGPYAGFVPISPALGTRPENAAAYPDYTGLVDYQDLFMTGIAEYFRYTGDADGLRKYWPNIKKLAKARIAFIDPSSGLVAGSPEVPVTFSFLGPANGSAVSGLFSFTLQRLAPLAAAMNDTEAADQFEATASKLNDAINENLWNPSLGTYSLATDSPGNFSLTGIAWCILSGAANSTQASSSIAKLEELRFGPGYKTISSEEESPDYQLAPNPSGFLLEALFQSYLNFGSDSKSAVTHLLDGLWGSMVNNDAYYSGASWEYVKPDGSPGIDLFTSLAHPWGAAPSYVLPEYLLGVRPMTPGYKSFVVRPAIGLLELSEASGRVPTSFGAINVSWVVNGTRALVDIITPKGTSGLFEVPLKWKVEEKGDSCNSIALASGHTQVVLQLL